VRFTSGSANFNGLAADNFRFAIVPELSSVILIVFGCAAIVGTGRRRQL
jgi:hypothetical protein